MGESSICITVSFIVLVVLGILGSFPIFLGMYFGIYHEFDSRVWEPATCSNVLMVSDKGEYSMYALNVEIENQIYTGLACTHPGNGDAPATYSDGYPYNYNFEGQQLPRWICSKELPSDPSSCYWWLHGSSRIQSSNISTTLTEDGVWIEVMFDSKVNYPTGHYYALWVIPFGLFTVLPLLILQSIYLYKEETGWSFKIETLGTIILKILSAVLFSLNYENSLVVTLFVLVVSYELIVYLSYLIFGKIAEIDNHKGAYLFLTPVLLVTWYFALFPLFFYFKKDQKKSLRVNIAMGFNIHNTVFMFMCFVILTDSSSVASQVLSSIAIYVYFCIPKMFSGEEYFKVTLYKYLKNLTNILTLYAMYAHFSDYGVVVLVFFLVYRCLNLLICFKKDKSTNYHFRLDKRMQISILMLNYIGSSISEKKSSFLLVTFVYYILMVVLKLSLVSDPGVIHYLSVSFDLLLLLWTWAELGICIAYNHTVFDGPNPDIKFRGKFKGFMSYFKLLVPMISFVDEITDVIYYFTNEFETEALKEASLAFLIVLPVFYCLLTIGIAYKCGGKKGLAIIVCLIPILVLWELKIIGFAILFLAEVKQDLSNKVWITLMTFELALETLPQMIIQIVNNDLTGWSTIAFLSISFAAFNNFKDYLTIGYYIYSKTPVVKVSPE